MDVAAGNDTIGAPSDVDSSIVIISDDDDATLQSVQFISSNFGLLHRLARYLEDGGSAQSLFRLEIIQSERDQLPAIHGSYNLLFNGLQFTPHFPFERRLNYRASFYGRALSVADKEKVLDFSFPKDAEACSGTVQRVYPSASELPENLLRFYVQFSHPMQRGFATDEIVILGPDGRPADDVLYRAPVELWDNSMRYLTVLLDPGRLKRGVGPNKELGSPLKIGENYTLVIGSNMTDSSGTRLSQTYSKHFEIGSAVRTPIDVAGWSIVPPQSQTLDPLVVFFPVPLDRALLAISLSVERDDGGPIMGRAAIKNNETQWSFEPMEPWRLGRHRLRVAWGLEDACGNSLLAPFDRPIRPGSDLAFEVENQTVSFDIK